jgi:hypothetical protein
MVIGIPRKRAVFGESCGDPNTRAPPARGGYRKEKTSSS